MGLVVWLLNVWRKACDFSVHDF